MIDYATWCAIRDGFAKHLTARQLARDLGLNVKTVRRWRARPYEQRAAAAHPSKLDPFKGRIVGWLDAHPLSAQQVFQRLREAGYDGGISIVKDDVHTIRPCPREAFLTLAFAPGEVAQVDWGEGGTIAVGETRRRRSFFVMVLAYRRQLYVEFTLAQTMEHFLAAHINAFNALGVPQKVMVDHLRTAVLAPVRGEPPQFNPRYLDFARHYGFAVVACNVAKGHEKGRVERGVGYVKANFLNGLELPDCAALNPALRVWLETVANVRRHRETLRRPVDRWTEERAHLQSVNPRPFDVGRVLAVRANRQFRVTFEANRDSVPARFAGAQVTLKAYPEHLCLDHAQELIARHVRSYARHQDREDPDHATALVTQRRHAQDAHVLQRFLARSPLAAKYHTGWLERRGNARSHVRKIVALADIHGEAAVGRALADALTFEAQQQRVHRPSDPGAGTPIAAAQPAGLAAPPGCPGPGTATTGPLALWDRGVTHMAITEQILMQQLERLQLGYFLQHYPDLVAQAARESWTHGRFLEQLVAGEAARRDEARVARRVKAAHLPGLKTLDGFDWSWPKKINRAQVQHLFRLEFLPQQDNVIRLGGVGVGKTHLAIALAHSACLQGHTVLFTRAVDIVTALAAAQATGGLKRELARLLKPTLLVVDELGYLPIDKFGADGLFQVISQRYEHGSTVITTNRAFQQWPEIFNNDSTLTSALRDRLRHHAESVVIEGRSYRMRDQTDT